MKNQKEEAAMPFEKVVDEVWILAGWVNQTLDILQKEADEAQEAFEKAVVEYATERKAKKLVEAAEVYALKARSLNDLIRRIKERSAKLPAYPKGAVESALQAHMDFNKYHDSIRAREDFQRLYPLGATIITEEAEWLAEGVESIYLKTEEEATAARQKGFLGWNELYKRYTQQW